ncbi:MAG: hypothetical protein ACWA47_08560 [Brevirhabdus sp.]
MRQMVSATALVALVGLTVPQSTSAQTTPEERVFDSANAILDTSIPFAIGARQAEQNLRGAFGWDTFQEGLVEGVYFRFDPDGYARFSVSPRLDTDVFEVICRPRTLNCEARKGSMTVLLDARRRVQLKFEQITADDTLTIVEGVSELRLPERVLQPLDARLEALLSAGGDLVHRRGDVEVAAISLEGFSAVVAYLRWVAARQDYTVLPRDWPVPNSPSDGGNLTQSVEWQSPMPQPQRSFASPLAQENATVAVSELASEMNTLRAELSQQASDVQPVPPVLGETALQTAERLARLELTVEYLRRDMLELSALLPLKAAEPKPAVNTPAQADTAMEARTSKGAAVPPSAPDLAAIASQLGIPVETLPVVLKLLSSEKATAGTIMEQPSGMASNAASEVNSVASEALLEDTMVRQILNGIETTSPAPTPSISVSDFQTLAEYLGRVTSGQ